MSEGKQRDIIDAAIRKFAIIGPLTTIADIANEAKIQESTIYRTCHSRENIVLLIYEKFWNEICEEIETVLNLNSIYKDYAALAKIKQIIEFMTGFFLKEYGLITAILKNPIPHEEELIDKDSDKQKMLRENRARIRQMHREVLKKIDKVIEEGQEAGHITRDIKAQAIRQGIMGTFMLLVYGTLQFSQEPTVGFDILEAKKTLNKVIDAFESSEKGS